MVARKAVGTLPTPRSTVKPLRSSTSARRFEEIEFLVVQLGVGVNIKAHLDQILARRLDGLLDLVIDGC